MNAPGIERYVAFMESLAPDRLGDAAEVVTDDMHFRDPFNDVHGRAHFVRCLEDMLEQLADLRITVTHVAPLVARRRDGEDAARYALYWCFGGHLRKLGNRRWDVTGVAVVTLGADGRVAEHLDFWDAAGGLYEQLPLVGALMPWLRRRFSAR